MSLAATPLQSQETSDEHSASELYATRFSGVVGAWFLERQELLTRSLISEPSSASLLDVGGGHAQLAVPLSQAGYSVTVLGSNERAFVRLDKLDSARHCARTIGPLTDIPFPDRSFDVVCCFRILPHEEQWCRLLAELCRVARTAVIVDYPTRRSLNAVTPFLFSAKKSLEKTTRSYRLFSEGEIQGTFLGHGFREQARHPQFFWPMVLHRTLKNRRMAEALEVLPRLLGVTRMFGSPVIARYERVHAS